MKVDTRKVDIAKNILNKIIRKLWNKPEVEGDTTEFSVSCYKNGRENGYTIRRLGLDGDIKTSVTFSECRSSDQYVVYHNIPIGSDGPFDDDYKKAKYFDNGTVSKCIDYCYKHLTKGI